jgi:hypothetical protein
METDMNENGISWGNVGFGYLMAHWFGPKNAMRAFVSAMVSFGVAVFLFSQYAGGIKAQGQATYDHYDCINVLSSPVCDTAQNQMYGNMNFSLLTQILIVAGIVAGTWLVQTIWQVFSPLEAGE